MLAEIFMLKLEMALRATNETTTAASHHVPFNRAAFDGFKVREGRRVAVRF
jgi:hypothetical protein